MSKFIRTINHGLAPVDLTHIKPLKQLFISEIHHKSNGSGKEPVFYFVLHPMVRSNPVITPSVFGHIPLSELTDVMKELGYLIRPLNSDDHD